MYMIVYIYIVGSGIHPFFQCLWELLGAQWFNDIYIYTIPINITFVGNVANEMP